MPDKSLDTICLGRVAVDLYGEQIGGRLEDMQSFAKYVGGSSGNMAIGMARQGLRVAMLSRVGDEHMGRFVREQLQREGVDVSHLHTDPDRLTALVVLGIRDRETFPLIFYRENCADMAIDAIDVDESFIASAKALVITGTHLSTERVNEACRTAIEYARRHDTRTVLDIDYRPVLWGLTGHGLGEERFIASGAVSEHIQSVLHLFDLIVGTQEEFQIAGGSENVLEALRTVRDLTAATLVLKRGESGVSIFPDAIPDSLDEGITVTGERVEVLNVLGAGDGFMAGFMRGWINDEPLAKCSRYGNGCGALVVSRHACSPAIPSKDELDNFLARRDTLVRPDLDPVIQRLHRIGGRTSNGHDICILAFDHRKQLEAMADEVGAARTSIVRLKHLIYQGAAHAASQAGQANRLGILVDGTYGFDVLAAATGRGWWIGRPTELAGSRPLEFQFGDDISRDLRQWPGEHVAKCLVIYDVEDDALLRQLQERQVATLYEACVANDREMLLEVVPPAGTTTTAEKSLQMLERFYDIGVFPDWWKLPQQSARTWDALCEVISRRDPHCRGIVILGFDAPLAEIAQSFHAAADHPLIKGFAIGRSIFSDSARAWFGGSMDDDAVIRTVADNFASVIDMWHRRDMCSVAKSDTGRAAS